MQCNKVEDLNDEFYLIGLYTKPFSGLFKCSTRDRDVKYQKLIIKIEKVIYSETQFTNNLLAGYFEIDLLDPKWILLNCDSSKYAIEYFINLHKQHIVTMEFKLKAFNNNLTAILERFNYGL